jgi:peptide/nickel transport system substrate-binding protein
MALVLTGQADFLQAFPIDQVAKLDSSKVVQSMFARTNGYSFMAFNRYEPKSKATPHPIFSDIRVRRALSLGVDRVGMLRNVFGGRGRLSHGPFPMAMAFGDSTLRLLAYDTIAARALLDSAGWKPGANGIREKNGRPLRFAVITPTTSLTRKQYSVLLQEQFRKLGVQMDIDQMEGQLWLAKANAGDFDADLDSFNTDPGISGEKQSWSTSGIGSANRLRYSNPKVDALLDSAIASFDPVKSRSASSRAFQQIIDDAPAIFLYDNTLLNAVHRRINLAPTRPDGWWVNLEEWSVAPDKRIDRDRIGLAPAKP